ncbi:MAG: ATP-dependent DNA helicase [Candidatus Altiarchaeota archaeon]
MLKRDFFPFEQIRKGQKELFSDSQGVLSKAKHLIAHAPTGIGKTVAVLAPALSFSKKSGKTVFFLTPKHTQHVIVVDTLKRIQRKFEISFSVVDFIGKQWMCLHKVQDLDSWEFHEFCRKQKKDEVCHFYNNVRIKGKLTQAMKDVVSEVRGSPLHNEKILLECSEKKLCPYEVCIEAAKKADVIIGDYFHLFQPTIREAFLHRLDKKLEDVILICDEAHNLPERIRSIMSVNLTEYSLKQAVREAKVLGYENLAEDLINVSKLLRFNGKKLLPGQEKTIQAEEFIDAVEEKTGQRYQEFSDSIDDLGEEVLSIPNRYRSYAKSVGTFFSSWAGVDLGYVRILKRDEHFTLSYKCLDPSLVTKELFEQVHSSILMSGTLHPLDMYADVLGIPENRTLLRTYESPFPKENKLVLLVPGLTTKFTKRSDYMYKKYCVVIAKILSSVPGNCAVFFPSYFLLDTIYSLLSDSLPLLKKEPLIERQGMGKSERRKLHQRLIGLEQSGGGVLFAVQAGSLSEGVDYADNLLDAVVIVGLPLERPDLVTQSLIEYYDFKFERGWDYGYIYPAMNRALQAAGRGIRSETDKGAIILLDERFAWKNYSKCFPADFEYTLTEQPEKYLKRFFSNSMDSASIQK